MRQYIDSGAFFISGDNKRRKGSDFMRILNVEVKEPGTQVVSPIEPESRVND